MHLGGLCKRLVHNKHTLAQTAHRKFTFPIVSLRAPNKKSLDFKRKRSLAGDIYEDQDILGRGNHRQGLL